MYIVGDVHGCYKTLLELVRKIITHSGSEKPQLCFVGDLIDRGPQSKDVVEFVRSNNHLCVLGNHEQMMIDYVPPGPYEGTSHWFQNGGMETLQSYGDDHQLIHDHIEWMKSLPPYLLFTDTIETDRVRNLVVSHSSVARYWKHRDSKDITQDIIWNRDISHGTLPSSNEIYNVFGHTVTKEPVVKDFYANIDTGCVYKKHNYGKLTAIHFPSLEIIQQDNIEI